jgi:sporulation protein YlmC with PRC-barrel domain
VDPNRIEPRTLQVNHRYIAPILAGITASLLSAQESPAKPTGASGARCKASQLIGCEITNSKNESLGEIQDIVLDGNNRKIAYAVVAFGGFLGMGEKYFAMPWRLIEVTQRGTDDKPRATLGLDQATLKAAPGFDKGKWPDMANAGWASQVDDYYLTRGEKARPDGATEPKGTGTDGTRGVDRTPGSKPFAHRRLGNLIGMDVVDLQHKEIAEVEDFVVDSKLATIDGALLSFGGTLGMGEKLVLVASESLTLDHEKSVFVFPCTTAGLETMALPDNKWPALNTEEWRTRSLEQCAKLSEVARNGDVIVADASGEKSVPFADIYDLNEVETVKGSITTIGSVRVGDLQEVRVRLRVRTAEGREVIVYAAPASYADQQALGLRQGKVVEVTGSRARYGSQTVLVAGSITVDGKSATLRDAKGKATWGKS